MSNATQRDILKDTGERMVPKFHKGHMVYGEHIVRYEAALSLVKGKNVLDIASGSGYGTAALAKTAKRVTGVDLDPSAVAYAQENYSANNVTFLQGSGTSIPLEGESMDVVVSFETIEHIKDYATFMTEVKRVLKPGGIFLLSTPNDVEFPESNHFHVHEFKEKELQGLVGKYFKFSKSYYQATWLFNALLPTEMLCEEWKSPLDTIQVAPVGKGKAIYFYMICSDKGITETIEPLAAISEHWSARGVQEYENSVRDHIEEQGRIIRHLEDRVNTKQAELERVEHQLKGIYASRAWKVVQRLRGIERHITRK